MKSDKTLTLLQIVCLADNSEACFQPEELEDLFTFWKSLLSGYLNSELEQKFEGFFLVKIFIDNYF